MLNPPGARSLAGSAARGAPPREQRVGGSSGLCGAYAERAPVMELWLAAIGTLVRLDARATPHGLVQRRVQLATNSARWETLVVDIEVVPPWVIQDLADEPTRCPGAMPTSGD